MCYFAERFRSEMNTVKNGKGDRPRNNWGPLWDVGYAGVDWQRDREQQASKAGAEDGDREKRSCGSPERECRSNR
jgi:hypothetical protein